MKKAVIACLVTNLILFSFQCSSGNSEETKIKFRMVKFEKKIGECDSTASGCAAIILEYPEISRAFSSAVKDSISSHILKIFLSAYSGDTTVKSLNELAESFGSNFINYKSEYSGAEQSWEIQGTVSVIYNNHSIISLQTDLYSYTGGAHPNSQTYYSNFNSKDGRRIFLSDILIKNFEDKLNAAAEKIFRENNKLEPNQNLEEAGYWFTGGKFYLNENFGIKTDGLAFYFNSYEIAPYSMGPTEILIPYSHIINLVKQDGLLINAAKSSE